MFESKLNKGVAGGYAGLDAGLKVPLGNLPMIPFRLSPFNNGRILDDSADGSTLLSTDYIFFTNPDGGISVNLPDPGVTPYQQLIFIVTGNNSENYITINGNINGSSGQYYNLIQILGAGIIFVSDGTSWWILQYPAYYYF